MDVKIEITSENLNYITQTSYLNAAQVIAFLSKAETTTDIDPETLKTVKAPTVLAGDDERLSDLITKSHAKSFAQKLTVGAYLAQTGNESRTFTDKNIREQFRKEGAPLPGNFSREFGRAMNAGYIYSVPGRRGEYALTSVGMDYIAQGFPAMPVTDSKRPGKKKASRGSAPTTLNPVVKNTVVTAKINNLPYYHSLKTKADRILWLLSFAHQNSIEVLSGADIETMAKKIHDNIKAKDVTALAKTLIVNNRAAREGSRYRILEDGESYLRSLATKESRDDKTTNSN